MLLCSPYFKTMFKTELDVGKQNEIEIKEVSREAMAVIVEYAYARKVEIREENVVDVFTASHLFQVKKLVDRCEKFIRRKLDESNCINAYKLASLYDLPQLRCKCLPTIERFFLDLCKTAEFLELNSTQIKEIIKSDGLNVHSEKQVLDSILKWTEHDVKTRKVFLPSLFKNVRLTLIPSIEELKKLLLLAQSDGCLQIIEEALSNEVQQSPATTNSEGSKKTRRGMHQVEMIIIYIADRLHVLNPGALGSRYYVLPPNLENRVLLEKQTLVVTEENEIFIIGGLENIGKAANHTYVSKATNYTFHYRKNSDSWVTCAPLQSKRYGCLCVALSGYIYALGSLEAGSAAATSVERYDVSQDTWEYGPPLLQPLEANSTAVAFRGKVYLIMEQTVLCLDPVSNTWSPMALLPRVLSGLSVVVFKGRLHCLGADRTTPPMVVVLVFDGTRWERHKLISFPCYYLEMLCSSAVVCQGALFLLLRKFTSLTLYKYDENHGDLEYIGNIDNQTEIPSQFLVASKVNPTYLMKYIL